VMPSIDRLNQTLATFADGTRVRFLNINDRLADSNGVLVNGVMNERDKLHPTVRGYQIWADALKPMFRELLGPPAAADLAPPATGDPGARGPGSGARTPDAESGVFRLASDGHRGVRASRVRFDTRTRRSQSRAAATR